jgi:hypothetical protein
MPNDLWETLSWIVSDAPRLCVWLVGIVVALATRRRHPRVSLLAALVFGVFFLEALAMPIVNRVLVELWHGEGMEIGLLFKVVTFGQSLVDAVLWVLLFFALFGRREQAGRIMGHDGQYLPDDFLAADTPKRPPQREEQ